MGVRNELSLLVGYLSSLIVILGGIWKALVSVVCQFQRWFDLRESRVLARQQAAVEKAHAEGFLQAYRLAWAYVFVAVFIYYALVKSAPRVQA